MRTPSQLEREEKREKYMGRKRKQEAMSAVIRKSKMRKTREEEEEVMIKYGADYTFNLLPELLQLIASKLTNFRDYVSFRSVCTRWHSSADTKGRHLWLPWLALSPTHNGKILPVFNPSDRSFYEFTLPKAVRGPEISVRGSAHGWLVMTASTHDVLCQWTPREVDDAISICLYNPITGAHILVPPISDGYVIEAQLCCKPDNAYPGQLLLSINVMRSLRKILIYRQGANGWHEIVNPPGCILASIVYHEVEATLYALYCDGRLGFLDLTSSTLRPLIDTPSLEIESLKGYSLHLVSAAAGDLLLVVGDSLFHVFKLDRSNEGCFKWARAGSIGDHTLFMCSEHVVTAICDQDFIDARANQIYHFKQYRHRYVSHDIMILADVEVRDVIADANSKDRGQLLFKTSKFLEKMPNIWYMQNAAWMVPSLN